MMHFFGRTNFDFVRWMRMNMGVSVALILVGLFAVYAREQKMFNSAGLFGIDFTGHPNLVKLLLPVEFEGFPLRKDFLLMTREAKEWPGMKEPAEVEH